MFYSDTTVWIRLFPFFSNPFQFCLGYMEVLPGPIGYTITPPGSRFIVDVYWRQFNWIPKVRGALAPLWTLHGCPSYSSHLIADPIPSYTGYHIQRAYVWDLRLKVMIEDWLSHLESDIIVITLYRDLWSISVLSPVSASHHNYLENVLPGGFKLSRQAGLSLSLLWTPELHLGWPHLVIPVLPVF